MTTSDNSELYAWYDLVAEAIGTDTTDDDKKKKRKKNNNDSLLFGSSLLGLDPNN